MSTEPILEQLRANVAELWAPLGSQVAFRVERGDTVIGINDAARLEVGSCFKAFVAAACCRAVDAGVLAWDLPLVITATDRVPSSSRLEALPDGCALSLREAVDAMLAVSDNTATDLVMRTVGVQQVRGLLHELELTDTTIPENVATVYREATDTHAEACVTTMRDLTRFYRYMYEGTSVMTAEARDAFLNCMVAEDQEQGTAWPEGVTCLRKSGSLEPPPRYVQGIAGTLLQNGMATFFAAAFYIPVADETIPEESALCFGRGLSTALRSLSEPTVSDQPGEAS